MQAYSVLTNMCVSGEWTSNTTHLNNWKARACVFEFINQDVIRLNIEISFKHKATHVLTNVSRCWLKRRPQRTKLVLIFINYDMKSCVVFQGCIYGLESKVVYAVSVNKSAFQCLPKHTLNPLYRVFVPCSLSQIQGTTTLYVRLANSYQL